MVAAMEKGGCGGEDIAPSRLGFEVGDFSV